MGIFKPNSHNIETRICVQNYNADSNQIMQNTKTTKHFCVWFKQAYNKSKMAEIHLDFWRQKSIFPGLSYGVGCWILSFAVLIL